QLRAIGLMTYYKHPGLPRTTLDDGASVPNAKRPPWVHPSVESIDIKGLSFTAEVAAELRKVAGKHLCDCIRHVLKGSDIEKAAEPVLENEAERDRWNTVCAMNPLDYKTGAWAVDTGEKRVALDVLDEGMEFAARILKVVGSSTDKIEGYSFHGF